MQSGGEMRVRQSAIRIFAQEYSESSLVERGIGEFAPLFIITKLGAKINRCLVCGGLESLERRDGDSGAFYRGRVRDPSGTHFFDIAPFQPELHPAAEELLARFESGDSILVSIVGRAKHTESEEGGIFTSIRAEIFTEVNQETYRSWMVETADSTLRRLDAYSRAEGLNSDEVSISEAGVPDDLIDGLIKSKEHYSDFDIESYKLWVLKALSSVTGKLEGGMEIFTPSKEDSSNTRNELRTESAEESVEASDAREVILRVLSSNSGEMVDYDSLVSACISAGSSREESEDAIVDLRDASMEISEPRFGYFSLVES